MRYYYYAILMLILLFCVPTVAQATIRITNLSEHTQLFHIEDVGNQERVIEVAPGKTWSSVAPRLLIRPIKGNVAGKPRLAQESDSFTYWPDGTFAIQQRRRLRGRGQ